MRILVFAYALLSVSALLGEAYSSRPDLKLDAMRVYGMRSAVSLDDTTVKVVIGSSETPARAKSEAYRIVSSDDEAYAYSKFVKAKGVVRAKPQQLENGAFGVVVLYFLRQTVRKSLRR